MSYYNYINPRIYIIMNIVMIIIAVRPCMHSLNIIMSQEHAGFEFFSGFSFIL